MPRPSDYVPLNCGACLDGAGLGFEISMAFQPIFDTRTNEISSQEALANAPRSANGLFVVPKVIE